MIRIIAAYFLIAVFSVLANHALAQNNGFETLVFSEDFESGNFNKWDQDSNLNAPEHLHLTSEEANVHSGEYAVELNVDPDSPKGMKLNKWFLPGYDEIYIRFYARFADNFNQGNLMHWVHVFGHNINNKWSGFGKAGIKPGGDDFFSVGIEPWRAWGEHTPPGRIMFYTYHMDMPQDSSSGKYWGENLLSDPPFIIERGRWYQYDMKLKLNHPEKSDGEQILWIDGEKVIHNKDMRYRISTDVRINGFWFSLYIHDTPKSNTCWFDDLQISTKPLLTSSVSNLH